jgi:putative nucleotidyltransferase with HDIG domain
MIKRVPTDQLQPGMYIHDLNCGWLSHPFVLNQFKLSSQAEIERIASYGIKEVYIDTSLGSDVPGAQTQAEIHEELNRKLADVVKETEKPLPHTAVDEELVYAKQVYSEANAVIHDIMSDVRFGKQIELEKIEPVVEKMTLSVLRNSGALTSLGRVKQKDDYTFQHSVSVGVLLINFCQHLRLGREIIQQAAVGGLLHDIGKMRTPNTILNKPTKLTDDEFSVMKQHVAYGIDILKQTPGISPVSLTIAAQHHERVDGSGYPASLKADAISQLGQMAAIVDVYDAITSNRIYHQAMEPTEALRKLLEWSKFHFNEDLVQHFIRCIGIYPVGTLVGLESGLLGVVIEEGSQNLLHPVVRVVYDSRKNCAVAPHDIDLARSGTHDRIVGHESAEKWRINPLQYL